MRTPQVFITRDQIQDALRRLAEEIRRDYRATAPLLLSPLKGSFIFLADLVRVLDLPVEIAFVRLSSYGSGTVSRGQVEVVQGLREDISGRDILIIEDIVDSGHTVGFLHTYLHERAPVSVRVCTLLDKPQRRQVPVTIDYCGFTIPDVFIVGYGLDWNEQYRHLPDIYVLAS
ncbi:MAG TPA: hypoxanthine phosphoribosyltransferase [Candidatus Tectomicrobia bacterium]